MHLASIFPSSKGVKIETKNNQTINELKKNNK
jgi:hypothetical protein